MNSPWCRCGVCDDRVASARLVSYLLVGLVLNISEMAIDEVRTTTHLITSQLSLVLFTEK